MENLQSYGNGPHTATGFTSGVEEQQKEMAALRLPQNKATSAGLGHRSTLESCGAGGYTGNGLYYGPAALCFGNKPVIYYFTPHSTSHQR